MHERRLHRADGDEEVLGDLLVGHAVAASRAIRNSAGVSAVAPEWSGAARRRAPDTASSSRVRAARSTTPLGSRYSSAVRSCSRAAALAGSPQGGAELEAGARLVPAVRRLREHVDGTRQHVEVAGQAPERAAVDAAPEADAEPLAALEELARQRDRLLGPPERRERFGVLRHQPEDVRMDLRAGRALQREVCIEGRDGSGVITARERDLRSAQVDDVRDRRKGVALERVELISAAAISPRSIRVPVRFPAM